MAVEIGTVQTFPDVKPDKAQALKVLEEAVSWIDSGEEYVSLSVNRFAAMVFAVAADYDELRDELETKR